MDTESQKNVRGILARLFLDSIYNEGKINMIYKNFPNSFILFLNSFDKIFTTNYDRNLELACNKPIGYLHGCFHILEDVYDPYSLRNQLYDKPVENTPLIKGYEYLFSNAIMGSSGFYKQFVGTMGEQANSGLKKICEAIKTKPHLKREVERWGKSDSLISKNLYQSVKLMSDNPDLQYPLDYHISDLKNLEGHVTFLGLSPYNDSHIFELLLENAKIGTIEYFYYNSAEQFEIENIFKNKNVNTIDVKEFWKSKTSP